MPEPTRILYAALTDATPPLKGPPVMSAQTPRVARLEIRPVDPSNPGANHPHTVVLVASNGEPLASSAREYSTRSNARRGVKALMSAMADVIDGYPASVREVQ